MAAWRMALLGAVGLALCACGPNGPFGGAKPAPAPPPPAPAISAEDAFEIQANAGRQVVLIERAMGAFGVTQAQIDAIALEPYTELPNDMDNTRMSLEIAWRSLRDSARLLPLLKEAACKDKDVDQAACAAFKPAEHGTKPQSPAPSDQEIAALVDATWTAMNPFVEPGCAKGRKDTKDDLYCSVE